MMAGSESRPMAESLDARGPAMVMAMGGDWRSLSDGVIYV